MTKKWNSIALPILTLILASAFAVQATAATIPNTPDGTVRHVSARLADGHPEVFWEALPASYQSDITDLTHLFATKVDAEVWDKCFSVLRKAAVVLQDKKDLFLGSKMFANAGEKKNDIADNWDTGTVILSTLANSDIGRLDTLKTINWHDFLATTGANLMEVARKASAATKDDSYKNEFIAKLKGVNVKVVSNEGGHATLQVSSPGEEPKDVEFVQVENRWVPADMAAEWDKDMAEAKTNLEQLTPEAMAQQKMQIMMMVGMAEAFVDQIAQAETSEQLDQMLQGMLGGLMGGMTGGSDDSAGGTPAETAPDKPETNS